MQQYELCILVAESKESELEKIKADVQGVLTQNGGTVVGQVVTFKKRLAYEVAGNYKGFFVAQSFEIAGKDDENYDGETVSKITRQLNLNNDVLRFLIVKADELPPLVPRTEKPENRPAAPVERRAPIQRKVEEKKEVVAPVVETPKVEVAPEKVEEKPVEEQKKEEVKKDDSIDKQLEEILHI